MKSLLFISNLSGQAPRRRTGSVPRSTSRKGQKCGHKSRLSGGTHALMLGMLWFLLAAFGAHAQDSDKLAGVLEGPGVGKLGQVAQIDVPAGCVFLDAKTTRALMEKRGDEVSGQELGLLRNTNGDWAVYFEFEDIGYVKDDDKDKLDAAKLLQSYQKGTAAGNKRREAAGRPPIEIVGWDQEPKYDAATHNLTWCLRARSAGNEFVNFDTRVLGRKGVMKVVLACAPEDLPKVLPEFTGLLATHKFLGGESYAEYRQGDKVAKYGLGALVLGGAAVGAAKLGLLSWVLPLFKKLWVLVVAVIVGVANFAKKLYAKLTGRQRDEPPSA